jgi:hypothetical protein
MKYTFVITGLIFTQFFAINNAVGQYTKGGSEKNYDRFNVSYDSIVTENKIPIQGLNSGYAGFTFSFLKTSDDLSRSQMTQAEYASSPNFAAPISTGKMGLKNGFNIGLNFQSPLKGINKNLIPQIDIGLNTKFSGSLIKYDWKQIYTDQTTVFYELFQDATYSPIAIISAGTGPSITFIHNPKKPIFYVDGYLRFNVHSVFGGNMESKFTDDFSTYKISIYRDQPTISFSPSIGLNFRIGALMLFVEKNFGIRDQSANTTKSFNESYTVDNDFDYLYYSGTAYTSNLLKYSNIQFGFGLVF